MVKLRHRSARERLLENQIAAVERVERALQDRGRVLVRYSGTQPMCRVMVEGPTLEETEKHCREIAEVVRQKLGCGV